MFMKQLQANNTTKIPMEITEAIKIIESHQAYKLGKSDKFDYTEAELNRARNTLERYNRIQANKEKFGQR